MEVDSTVPGIPDALIRRVEQLEADLPDSSRVDQYVQAKPGSLLFSAPNVGSFLIRDGRSIEFAPRPDADPGTLMLLLNGTARGALIHQRGELPLHAATLLPPGKDFAVAICGKSGAGKSTLAAALSRNGWRLLADDTTRVSWDGTKPIAWPSRDTIKLWRDACEAMGIDPAGLERVTNDLDKYYVRVAASDEPARLGCIVELSEEDPQAALSAGEKMALVSRNTYRANHIAALGTKTQHFRIVAQTVSSCRVFKLAGKPVVSVATLVHSLETIVG